MYRETEKSNIAVIKKSVYKYPTTTTFRPSILYPEYQFIEDVDKEDNEIYDMVRESLFRLGLDKNKFGTKEWCPLGDIIKPGDTVLIKPNLVMDKNYVEELGTDCLYTHPSVVAPIIDYVISALKGKGKIIVGDAPMQDCNFRRLERESGYGSLIDFYQRKGVDIELIDFRGVKGKIVSGVRHTSMEQKETGIIVNLGDISEHSSEKSRIDKFRITNYDPRVMHNHHTKKFHEYCITKYLLEADVVINMPKPKTHRKAGMTGALKNNIGVNVRKEYLPHHTMGSIDEGGDEYSKRSTIRGLRSRIIDRINIMEAEEKYKQAKIFRYIMKALMVVIQFCPEDYVEGNWYGNDTISKTIIDINRIVMYADKEGIIRRDKQRKNLVVGDMIVSGEKEGPLMPTAKPVGIIIAGVDPVIFDKVLARFMGFDFNKIPTIVRAVDTADRLYPLTESRYRGGENVIVASNNNVISRRIKDIPQNEFFDFEPTSGWKGYIEIKHNE